MSAEGRFPNRIVAGLGLGLGLIAAIATPRGSTADHAETAWQVASKSVVSVLPTWPGYRKPGLGAPPGTAPEGTGVAVLERGLIATAAHVVSQATEISIRDHAGRVEPAEILASDPATDIAVLTTNLEVAPIDFASERPDAGAHVCVIGNAFGLDLSLSCGIVSAPARSGIGFNPVEDFVQTDAAVNPGASGGALINEQGELVGLVSAIFTKETDTNVGVNFAVSAELLRATAVRMLAERPAD